MNSSPVRRYLPWVVAVALFMEGLDTTIVNTAVPAIAEGLQVTPVSLKAAVTIHILSLAVCIPVSGWMADRYGTRTGLAPVAIWRQGQTVLPSCFNESFRSLTQGSRISRRR